MPSSEEVVEWFAFGHQLVWPPLSVMCLQVVDAHCVEDGVSDVCGCRWLVGRVFTEFIGGTVNRSAGDSTSSHQVGQAMSPVVSSGTIDSAAARIPDAWFASHFTGDHQQCFIQQTGVSQVFDQCREGLVELRQQVFLQAGKVASVSIPASSAAAFLWREEFRCRVPARRL